MQHFTQLDKFLQQLPNINNANDLAVSVAAVSVPLGLPTIMAGAILVRGDQVDGHFYFGNWTQDWQTTYLESIFAKDPLVQEARRRIVPFTWSELWAEGDLPQATREVIELGKQHGWSDGYVVPIHGPGGYVALVSFAGGPINLTVTDRAVLLALAHASHQRGRVLYGKDPIRQQQLIKLTPREIQVMRWIARGKTDSQIATILSLSVATVHGYVEQAKHKLGVRSRSQAVSELTLREMLITDK